ncbi:MAG: succinate dehydrogenase assembly factor 2 [Pseudomonadota bacterium]
MTDLDARRRRLIFRATHRGFKEADLVIGLFAKAHVPSMEAGDLDALEALLEAPDQELYAWVTEREPVPENFDGEMFRRLKAFKTDDALRASLL